MRACPSYILKNTARCMVYCNDFDGAREMPDISMPRSKNERPVNWAMLA